MKVINEKIRVLYVDDEDLNLKGFYATHRRSFYVKTAISAKEAREILKEDWFHVIVADQRMPHETGVDFLTSYAKVDPKPIRILITAYADITSVIKAINEGQIFKYIVKPEANNEAEFAIKEAYELYKARDLAQVKTIELEKTNRELDKFIYSASHDLRAPLLSILGLTSLAKQDEGNALKYVEMIDKSANKLDAFLLNLINYYKNAKLEVYAKEFDLLELVNDTYHHVLYFDGADKISFVAKANSDSSMFITDKTKLSIILNNLITNCIRYRDKEKEKCFIHVDVTISKEEAVIKITDNGIGMSQETLDKVFTMFYKATKKSQGSGIGMYIVKDSLDNLGGKIDVASRLSEGTCFTVTIPALSPS